MLAALGAWVTSALGNVSIMFQVCKSRKQYVKALHWIWKANIAPIKRPGQSASTDKEGKHNLGISDFSAASSSNFYNRESDLQVLELKRKLFQVCFFLQIKVFFFANNLWWKSKHHSKWSNFCMDQERSFLKKKSPKKVPKRYILWKWSKLFPLTFSCGDYHSRPPLSASYSSHCSCSTRLLKLKYSHNIILSY